MLSPLSFSGQCTLCRQALSYREGTQISGVWTSLLTEDEGPKQNLSQKLCCFGLSQKLLASLCTFSPVQNTFRWSSRTKMAPADPEAKASQAGWTPVLWLGRWPDVWSPKMVLPQKLCGSRLSQKLLASVVHTLTCPELTLSGCMLRNLLLKNFMTACAFSYVIPHRVICHS